MGIRSTVFMSRLSLVKTKSMGSCVVVVFFLQLYCLHKLRVRVMLFVKGFTCPARGNYTCFEVRNKSWSYTKLVEHRTGVCFNSHQPSYSIGLINLSYVLFHWKQKLFVIVIIVIIVIIIPEKSTKFVWQAKYLCEQLYAMKITAQLELKVVAVKKQMI